MSKENIAKVLNALEGAQLTPEQLEEIKCAIYGTKLRSFGEDVPPPAPGDSVPEVPMQPGGTTIPQSQAETIESCAAMVGKISTELRSGSGWRSRKLWVALITLAGMLAQLPMQEVLPPVSQIVICVLAGLYIAVQGILDASAKPRLQEPSA